MNKNNYVDYLYNKLPSVYREEDLKLDKPLYRYLSSLCAGGFEKVIEDSNNFLTLVDPEKCPESFFPYLYESFGLDYFKDIPIEYHRKFLSNLGALMKRRGTNTAIKYLVSTLTGFDVDLRYERQYNSKGECTNRNLYVEFLVTSMEDAVSVPMHTKVIERFIKSQVPFYITPIVSARVEFSALKSKYYTAGAISMSQRYTLTPNLEGGNA